MAGWLVLNTDASKPEESGDAAIGSDPAAEAATDLADEGRCLHLRSGRSGGDPGSGIPALIEGLKLAFRHHPDDLQVFTDSAIVADQIRKEAPKMKPYMKPLHAEVRRLLAEIGAEELAKSGSGSVGCPGELNREADQRASDAFFKKVDKVWLSPASQLDPRVISGWPD